MALERPAATLAQQSPMKSCLLHVFFQECIDKLPLLGLGLDCNPDSQGSGT